MKLLLINSVLLLYSFFSTKHAMIAYQQNRYQIERYIYWMKQTIKKWSKQQIYMILGCIPIYFLGILNDTIAYLFYILLLSILSYILYKIERKIHYIKPLVYTARIKRLYQFIVLIYIVIFSMCYMYIPLNYFFFLTPIFYIMPWFMIIIAGSIMNPFEYKIRMHYVQEAHHIVRRNKELKCIGITGSYGKTSIKQITKYFLEEHYDTLATPHSYNNLMGITLTIRKYLKNLHEVFICEMGSDHSGELQVLSTLVPLDYAIVCAIGPQHLQTFKTMDAIIKEKMSLVENLNENKTAILNIDYNEIYEYKIKNTCKVITYGERSGADYQIVHITYTRYGTSFGIVYKEKEYLFHTKLLGKHNVSNLACAIVLAHTMHIPFAKLQYSCTMIPYVKHRLEMIQKETYTLLDDSYNSNPIGAANALEVLKQMPSPRILMTPGFIDLGEMTQEKHLIYARQMMEACDEIILIGQIQCVDIIQYLKQHMFPLINLHIVESTKEAFLVMEECMKMGGCALIENDLPDIFNH